MRKASENLRKFLQNLQNEFSSPERISSKKFCSKISQGRTLTIILHVINLAGAPPPLRTPRSVYAWFLLMSQIPSSTSQLNRSSKFSKRFPLYIFVAFFRFLGCCLAQDLREIQQYAATKPGMFCQVFFFEKKCG